MAFDWERNACDLRFMTFKIGELMSHSRLITLFEVTGSALAIAYALLIASNTGNEILGFALLLASAGLFAAWGVLDKRWAFLSLQFFYAASAVIGLVRWA
jgi:hypothetical protein